MLFKNENDELLFWSKILDLSEGRNDQGFPNSHSSFYMIESKEEGQEKILENVFLKNAALQLLPFKDTMIVSADFPRESTFEYKNLKRICERWINPSEEEDITGQQIFMTIIPDALLGQISLFLPNLLSFSSLDSKSGGKVLMVFDLEQAQIAETENIDYKAISNAIGMELDLENENAEKEILTLEKEIKDLQNETEYTEHFKQHTEMDKILEEKDEE